MPESNRTVTASTKVSGDTADFLDAQAEKNETTQAELLRRLIQHYREAEETGLTCPHCKNEVLIDL